MINDLRLKGQAMADVPAKKYIVRLDITVYNIQFLQMHHSRYHTIQNDVYVVSFEAFSATAITIDHL